MLKTNSKKTRENIKNYIIKYMNDYTEATGNFYKVIYNTFLKEAEPGSSYNRKYSEQEIFTQWATGLPINQLFCYYYNREAKKDLIQILEETPEEAAKFSEEKAEELLTSLIYREIKTEA